MNGSMALLLPWQPGPRRGFGRQPEPVPAAVRGGGRTAVFVDIGGTLVENAPFNADPARLRLMPAALNALGLLAAAGHALLVLSNQSGLAAGSFTRAQFAHWQGRLCQRLRDEAGLELLDFVICPHAPAAGGKPACLCRKPAPGMLLRAARTHGLDLQDCWMLGNTLDDIEAGRRAGCQTVLLDSGAETLWRRSPLRQPHAHCASWGDVAPFILSAGRTQQGQVVGQA